MAPAAEDAIRMDEASVKSDAVIAYNSLCFMSWPGPASRPGARWPE